MPSYTQNNPAGAQIAEPNFQLKERSVGAVPDSIKAPEFGFVLDRSYSMHSLCSEAVSGFNTLINEQRSVAPPANLTLELFCSVQNFLYQGIALPDVPPLSASLYDPTGGGTALNDAIGSMIQTISKRAKRSTRVLIAILTDGAENSSRQFSNADILSLITYRRTIYDWQFVFIGPEEALSYALSIGIPKSNVVSFSIDPAGMKLIMERLSKSMRAYQLGDSRYHLLLTETKS